MKTIAVVEDNPDNRLLVRAILEPEYRVVEYESGKAALDGLSGNKPDLVLLDVSLPEMDGAEVLRRLRADATLKDLPVIALTAHAMAGDRERFVAAGFDDYVSKPILDEQLLIKAIGRNLPGKPLEDTPAPKASATVPSSAIDRLCELGGNAFARDMIDLFLTYGAQKLAEARQARQTGKMPDLADAVHAIKSSAGNVGATVIQDLCAQIEQAVKLSQTELAATRLAELEAAFGALMPELEREKVRLTQPPPA
jgi:CheY-like chemotaxis protein